MVISGARVSRNQAPSFPSQAWHVVLWLCMFMLASCAGSPFSLGPTPKADFCVAFTVDARQPWHHTGLPLIKGKCYTITATESKGYADSTIPCSAAGPKGRLGTAWNWLARDASHWWNIAHWAGPGEVKHLRVLKDANEREASFLTLIAAVGLDDSQSNVITVGKGCTFSAPATGELVLFANDWPGLKRSQDYFNAKGELQSKSYQNNKGTLSVTVHRFDCPKSRH